MRHPHSPLSGSFHEALIIPGESLQQTAHQVKVIWLEVYEGHWSKLYNSSLFNETKHHVQIQVSDVY
jgi:hypothetical protein